MRVPAIAWGPGLVRPGVLTHEMGSTMDLFTTCLKLAGAEVPRHRVIDGLDLTPVLTGKGPSPRDTMFYYRGTRLFAVRKGPYKAHLITQVAYGKDPAVAHDPPLLYHLGHDPAERFDVAKEHPEVLAEIRKLVAEHQATMKPGENQLEKLLPTKK